MPASFDFVVVGAGSAGCVVAARLSQDPARRVLLLELGGDGSSPALADTNVDRLPELWAPSAPENWGYRTTPQAGLAGRSLEIARGKVVGGSSAINAMLYVRGSRFDFDHWRELGNRGWGYADVLPYFKRSERYHGPASDYHGRQGPLSVIDYRKPSELSHAFVEAAGSLGQKRKYNDFNAESQLGGAGFYQSTRTPDGARVSAASAFVAPSAERPNLQLLSGARAVRVLFEGRRAVGVEYARQGRLERVRAEREVVLCGGAFETPKLLLLSGVGPSSELARHGIAPVQALPGVGQNLHDHLMLGVGFASRVPLEQPELLAEAGLFLGRAAPELQYFFGPLQFVAPEYRTAGPAFTFTPILLRPRSRGSVVLASADPAALARVDPGYLQSDDDVAVLRQGIRYARELASCRAFDSFRGRELAPGEAVVSDAQLTEYVRRVATTVWHPAGSCKMGADAAAVVDDELRVHGVTGLRIADASVMPRLVSGNPNAAVMMIAERAADLLLGRELVQPAAESAERVYPLEVASAPLGRASAGVAHANVLGEYAELVRRYLSSSFTAREPRRYLYQLVEEQLEGADVGLGALICLASCAALGGDVKRALPTAAAIALRQGSLRAHAAELDAEAGDAALGHRHGLPLTLNAGDAMSALSLRALKQNSALLGAPVAARVLEELEHASLEALEGRAIELGWLGQRDFGVGEQDYLLVLLKKVGWVGYIEPARLGGLLAGLDVAELDRFNRFGYLLAAAREIARDARDAAQDAARHLLSGRRTLVQTHVYENASRAERERLIALAAKPKAQRLPRDAGWLKDAVRAHGSSDYALEVARAFARGAERALPEAYAGAGEGPALAALRGLVSDLAAGHVLEQRAQERQIGAR